MHLVEVFERCRQLPHHGRSIAQVHAAEVIAAERVDEACQAMLLLCGLHTGVLTGFRPSCLAICRVWAAM